MLPSQEDGHIFSSAYASAEFFWGQSVSHQADVTLDEDSFARDLMAGNGTNGDSGYPQTFFESVGKAFCSSTDDMHCLTDSFLTAPAAAIFILMIPFLFTNAAAAQGSLPEASRTGFTWSVLTSKHRRRFRFVQLVLSVVLALLPPITAILQETDVITEEKPHIGTWLWATFTFIAWSLNCWVIIRRTCPTDRPLPDYFQLWYLLNWLVEVVTLIVAAIDANKSDTSLLILDSLTIVHSSLLTILVFPSLYDSFASCGRGAKHANTLGGTRGVVRYVLGCGFFWRYDVEERERTESRLKTENTSLLGADATEPLNKEGKEYEYGPEECAGVFSRVFYTWISPLLTLGYERPLTFDDLPFLSKVDRSETIASGFSKTWKEELERAERATRPKTKDFQGTYQDVREDVPNQGSSSAFKAANDPFPEVHEDYAGRVSLVRPLVRSFGPIMYSAALFKATYDALMFVGPNLLHAIVNYLDDFSNGVERRASVGFGYVGTLFGASVLQTMLLHQYFFRVFRAGQQLRSAVIIAVYRKALRLSIAARQDKTVGEIVNVMSTDAQRMQDLTTYLQMIWSAPFQISLATYFLWQQIGAAVFAGIGVMILLMPLNAWLARTSKRLQEKLMKTKDRRVNLTNEVLNGIRLIKYSAWEVHFRGLIQALRSEELRRLWYYMLLQQVVSVLFVGLPTLVSLSGFGVYIAMGNQLTAATAFTALSLFNILRFPLTMLPNVINNVVEASVSIRRIRKFLLCEEREPGACIRLSRVNGAFSSEEKALLEKIPKELRHYCLGIHHGEYTWHATDDADNNKGPEGGSLHDINFYVKEGSLVTIAGTVGCGKSSLLLALLGEMRKRSGTAWIFGSVAYVSQTAFILNATVKDNILFGKPFSESKYKHALKVCQLESDLDILPAGDETEIGERGVNLSGGQKQRVSLARAIYADADVYLFDDPLSAVDSHVGHRIFEDCMRESLQGKTRVLVTHGLQYLAASDYVYVMERGRITENGTYQELLKQKNTDNTSTLIRLVNRFETEANDVYNRAAEQAEKDRASSEGMDGSPKQSTAAPLKSKASKQNGTASGAAKRDGKLIKEEESEKGNVSKKVYLAYGRATGGCLAVTILFLSFGFYSAMNVMVNWWLSYWSDHAPETDDSGDGKSNLYYYRIYVGLSFAAIFLLIVSRFFVALLGIRASNALHERLIRVILHAMQSFFDTTPVGRILNRFSQDIYTVDERLPTTFSTFLMVSLNVISTLVVISTITPWFLVALVPILVVYIYIQRFYVTTSRELRRLDSVSKSPIFANFSQTLNGFVTIRAYKENDRFIQRNDDSLDRNQQAYFMYTTSNRWLAVRLELIGALIVGGSALFAVIARGTINSSLAGLSISYALGITQALNWVIRMAGQAETYIVAVERINEYSSVVTECDPDETPEEALEVAAQVGVDQTWPQKGEVSVRDLSLAYRRDGDYVLHDISFKIRGCEKVGICGRTGAGKSSLVSALYRLADVQEGTITIDGIDIRTIPLNVLRSRISIIPQDPTLFSGTLRRNLDPLERHSDAEIWRALSQVSLEEPVRKANEQLNSPVSEGGENWSDGQRQLICMARALLRNSKIIILDEATASVDVESDAILQQTIRNQFKNNTVITIAHRVHTILDSDRVMVLDDGEIAEFDSPSRLLSKSGSLFSELMKSSKQAAEKAQEQGDEE
eukprot:gb/GECG01001326.1/.p1 GENE.gb/GECG01001326.1/~~gb/GECG01001326.1/.p1  ORF type:complete len:1688 (+),score=180.73 gb/GECG01001326.1/:1-5064(+)